MTPTINERYQCPSCSRYNCFAYDNGKCVILRDNDFGRRECPFFKTQRQLDREEEKRKAAEKVES